MSIFRTVEGMTALINPYAAAGQEQSLERALGLGEAVGLANIDVVTDIPDPKHIQAAVDGKELIYSGGGDGTINWVVSAIIGHVRDDPEATANNLEMHTELASELLYVPGADGNGNNHPLSALGKHFSRHPARLARTPRAYVGYHRPLLFDILDKPAGEIVRSGISVDCIGIGAAALAAGKIEAIKPEVKDLGKLRRLGREGLASFSAIVDAPAFSAVVTRQIGDHTSTKELPQISGFELVGSGIYAKEGRTRVNIDDDYQQPVILRHADTKSRQRAVVVGTMLGVKFAKYRYRPLEFAEDVSVSLRLTSDAPIPMHTDGETGERYRLEPGQTLRLRRSKIAVPTVMAR